jgi:hypothetical protein
LNRAVAAVLLARTQTLLETADGQAFVSEEQIAEWAHALQVSEMMIHGQLRNRGLAIAP